MYIIIALISVAAVGIIAIYNRFIRYRALMREAWSGVDVQLKRRHDLVPNIVETVKGYMQHERKLLEDIAEIRSKVMSNAPARDRTEAEKGLSQALRSIFALAENYPDLKANQNFLELQKGLSEIEDQIQMARRYYNGTVRNYNVLAESFPSNLIAGLFNFIAAEFFEIEYATERKVPDVKFGS